MNIKQGTQFSLIARPTNVSLDVIRRIEFIFKQSKDRTAETLKFAVYPGDVTRSKELEGAVSIPFTADETYRFTAGRPIYMDTRVWLAGLPGNPETNIVRLNMSPTLFDSWEEPND